MFHKLNNYLNIKGEDTVVHCASTRDGHIGVYLSQNEGKTNVKAPNIVRPKLLLFIKNRKNFRI